MGRAKGKGKKQSIAASREDGSGEEEKLPAKRRGRPTKALKEDVEEGEPKKIEIEDDDEGELSSKDVKGQTSLESGKKRKKPCLQGEEELEVVVKNENGVGHEPPKAVGFRHIGSRRKNKPRRAAEVGVSAHEVCSWLLLRS